MFDSSRIELSKSALSKNLRFIQKEIGSGVTIASVVKGNAYGHGIDPFVRLAESCGQRQFYVFDASEAYKVHRCLKKADSHITIMGYADREALAWAIEHDVSFFVFDSSRLDRAIELGGKIAKRARVHLELETGMNRTGLANDDLNRAVEKCLSHPDCVRVEGLCTHYAGAESVANYKRVGDQIALFEDLSKSIASRGLEIPIRHTAASAAALAYPETRMDLVRIGITQYGFWPSKEIEMQYVIRQEATGHRRHVDPLKRVLRWSSRVMHVARVKPGEFVGYGTSYQTTRTQTIATVPVGYSHGFRRNLSNLGRVLIHGKRAEVVGVVNMSMLQVDVTAIDSVKPGDEVVIIGKQKKAHISVSSFSDMSNLVNYEMLVRLPTSLPRVVVD